MSVLSNLYVEKASSEHPIAVWMLNEQVDFISIITENEREFEDATEWTLTNATAIAETPPQDTPIANVHVSRIIGNNIILDPSGGTISALSVDTYPIATFVETLANVSLAFYLYFDNPNATSIKYGYQYFDPSLGITVEVTETTAVTISDASTWKFFATTFDIPPAIATNIKLLIEIDVGASGGSGGYDYLINGLSFGQWSEDFHRVSVGVTPELVSANTVANEIAIPNNLKILEAVPYGTSGISGYYLSKEELYANNYGIPLVFGSNNVTKIYPNVQSGTTYPSLIFPGYGFLNEKGRFNQYTAEMWLRINTDSIEPHRIFGPIASNDGLYVEGGFLTLVLNNKYISHYVGEWMRPMLVQIRYIQNNMSLVVNGDFVGSFEFDENDIELPSEFDRSVPVSTTGTVGSISGTGPWTATITGMSSTAELGVGSVIDATNGTGSLGSGGTYIVTSIVSGTSITYTATGGTTPVAGTITNIKTTKNQDWVGFYASDDVHPIDIDSYAIYSYLVPTQVAKRRWVWGQAVVAPEQTNSAFNANTAFVDYGYSKYAVNYNYPDFANWQQAYFSNLITNKNFLQLPQYKLPTFNLDEKTQEEWYDDISAIVPATATRTNLHTNPSIETNTNAWTENGGQTVTRSSDYAYTGSYSLKTVANLGWTINVRTPQASWFTVTQGLNYTVSLYALSANSTSSSFIRIRWYNASNTFISEVTGTASALTSSWQRYTVSGMAPVLAVKAEVWFSCPNPTSSTTMAIYMDSILLEQTSSILPYFDGSYTSLTPNYNPVTAWTGTANASTSTLTAIADSDDADGRKYFTFRPNGSWNSENCSIYFKNFNILNERIETFYGVFKTDGTAVNQPLFKLGNNRNADYILAKINGTTLTYTSVIKGVTTTIATKTVTANQKFTAGINIKNLSTQSIAGISDFLSNQTQSYLYIAGDGTTTFTGRMYRFGFDSKYNNRKINTLYGSNGIFSETTNDAETMYSHVANYTLKLIAKYGILFSDIGVAAYWEDYVPLTYFAKYVTDYTGERYFDLDMLQLNLDFPEPLETQSIEFTEAWTYGELKVEYATPIQLTYAELDNNIYTGWDDYEDMAQQSVKYYYYDTEENALKSYISFQKISEGANKNLVEFTHLDVARVKGVIDPNFVTTNWEDTAFEFVDGQIVYPPLTDQYGRDISFEDLAVVIHLDFASEGILHHPVTFRDLQLASLVLNRDQLTEVGTKFGLPTYPYYKVGNYYEVKSKNPFSIYKGSTPHLYLNRHSGYRMRGDLDPIIDRGIAVPINQQGSEDVEVSAIQMWLRYSDRVFPTGETEIFSINFAGGTYYFYITGDSSTQRGYITVKNQNGVSVADSLEFYISGVRVDVPYLNNEEWAILGIAFPNLISFDTFSGQINLNGPLTYNNIAYYLATNLQQIQSTQSRTWGGGASPINSQTWSYWSINFTWQEALALSTTSRYFVNPTEIYDKYVGTNRIIVDDNVDGILFDPEKFTVFGETEWKPYIKSAV